MQPITVATAQFENRSGDKAFNLERMHQLALSARQDGATVIAFHECCVTGYTFARHLTHHELFDLAEPIPSGPSISAMRTIARDTGMVLLGGLFERGDDGQLYKAHVCVDRNGLIAKFRKLHPFIHPSLKPGTGYVLFDLFGWTCSILVCYDNNVIENVRAVALSGARILFAPHVTMCTPSTRPGAGFVDPALWADRIQDPTSLRTEFDGLKGRAWLMKWLPARAYDNALFVVFSNAVGMDGDQLKNGCSMILDPFGDVIAECRKLDDDRVSATLNPQALTDAGGYRYREARRVDLYRDILVKPHTPRQIVSWKPHP
ncbi:MAG: nitrilase [Lentisphaerae bacterium RIFOXYC12_FULL_60_16]|nr:MAG: nitrilase [Lentisphaerae bacterium RIFOXYC12_FULL_60_16]